jgi:hypothetical protein
MILETRERLGVDLFTIYELHPIRLKCINKIGYIDAAHLYSSSINEYIESDEFKDIVFRYQELYQKIECPKSIKVPNFGELVYKLDHYYIHPCLLKYVAEWCGKEHELIISYLMYLINENLRPNSNSSNMINKDIKEQQIELIKELDTLNEHIKEIDDSIGDSVDMIYNVLMPFHHDILEKNRELTELLKTDENLNIELEISNIKRTQLIKKEYAFIINIVDKNDKDVIVEFNDKLTSEDLSEYVFYHSDPIKNINKIVLANATINIPEIVILTQNSIILPSEKLNKFIVLTNDTLKNFK